MNIIQSVLQAVNNYFTFTSPTERKTLSEVHGNKRIREEDDADENDDVVFVRATTPPKRMRLLDEKCSIFEDVNVEMSSRPSSSTIGTQTNTKQKLGHRNDDEWISLLDDENTTLSPTKFKNTYKAPKHVRYPFKRRERDATHSREPLSSVVAPVRNTVLPSALKFQPRSTPVPKRNIKNFGSSVSLWGLPLFGGGMNRAEYEKLLGSVISNPAKELMRVQPVKVRHGTFVDLTDDADETPTIDLTAEEGRWPPLAESSRIPTVELEKKSTPRVKPQIITIKDDASETVSPRQKVNRVNSFEEKISKNKFTKSELVSNGIAEYKNYILKFNELEAQHKATSSCGNKFTTEALSDLLEKRIASHLKITESLLDEEVKEVVDEKPVLTDDMLAKVNHALNQSLRLSQVLVTKFKLDITRSDFMTLKNEAWLNDAVINFYMELIVERGETVISYPSVYAFSTFFYPALKNGYDRVRRYTKKVDLFSKDLILVPIHLAVHWCLAKIDMKKKQIVYYDSMLQSNQRVLNMLLDYLSSEYKDKKKTDFDPTGWTTSNDKDIPVQKNGSDCGVFACTFGEYSARQAKFNFTQDDMPYMRKKMVYEILSGKLLVP